ncbi:NADH:flavin oxidoreductase/NADH oxidase [Microbacterium sp.]|uniref:oxidoreductase n=1 Tax=Microbacterium sp. TaxID=51671 RepID=UPI003C75DD25
MVAGAGLFTPLDLRELHISNRLWLSPMCQYSAVDGVVGDWHLAHLGDRASGGWGLLSTEATAVSPEGRITRADAGIWTDVQRDAWARIVDFVHSRGAPIALQLAHAGRKASLPVPWTRRPGVLSGTEGGWRPLSATDAAFPGLATPRRADGEDLSRIVAEYANAARRGVEAGFDAIDVLAGHGFLIHSFLSPLVNDRDDDYADRARLLEEVVVAIRASIPAQVPLLLRVSSRDWVPGGLTDDDTAEIVARIAPLGVDLVSASSGGLLPADIPIEPGYQVSGAARIRERTSIPTAAVGLITDAAHADRLIRLRAADAVQVGRAALRDPYFALRAAHELGADVGWQPQYERGAWA